MGRMGWMAVATFCALGGCDEVTDTRVTNPNLTVMNSRAGAELLGSTRVDSINARLYQAGDLRYAELDAINSNNAAWNARFTRAALQAAQDIAGCPAMVRAGTELDDRPPNSRPFRLAVRQNC